MAALDAPATLALFLVGLLGVSMMLAGTIIAAGRKKDHYLGGLLITLGLLVVAIGWLGPASQ